MITTTELIPDGIATALAEIRNNVRGEGPAAWEVQTRSSDHRLRVWVADDWLLFEAPLDGIARAITGPGPGCFLPEKLIQWNGSLPGGVKFGTDSRFNLALRTEVPLIEDIDPGPRLLESWNGIEAGLARFYGEPEEMPVAADAADLDLATLAGDSGWTFNERPDGRLAFDLPSPAGTLVASLQKRERGGARIWVPLAPLNDLTSASTQALAVLLLRAGSVLRLARPVFETDGGRREAGLEVVFNSAPKAAELTQALESLVVGVALISAEAKLLCEEQTAREYLTVGTWTPREQWKNNNNQVRGQDDTAC